MNLAILVVSSVSLAVSATTLVVVLVGAKKVDNQVSDIRDKTNRTVGKIKAAFDGLEL